VAESTDEIIERIFAAAKADEEARIVAERFATAHAEGRWEAPVLDHLLRQSEEES
jgi:hypothetical protein